MLVLGLGVRISKPLTFLLTKIMYRITIVVLNGKHNNSAI